MFPRRFHLKGSVFLLISMASLNSTLVGATVYGPGALSTPISIGAGTIDSIVSNTTFTLASGVAVNVTNGNLSVGDIGGTVSITTVGSGLMATGVNAFITAQQTNVTTSGPNNDSVFAKNGGQITLTGGTVDYNKNSTTTEQMRR